MCSVTEETKQDDVLINSADWLLFNFNGVTSSLYSKHDNLITKKKQKQKKDVNKEIR